MHRARPQKKLNIMEKRIPSNPKFRHVTSKLDTGSTVDKLNLISHRQYLRRRDEQFYRIPCTNLSELYGEYEDLGKASGPEMVATMVPNENGDYVMERQPVGNQGHLKIVAHDAEDTGEEEYPYLVLDVRSVQEFSINRLHRAKSFQASHVNRDRLIPELYQFKNKENTLIVLYEDEERLAVQVANSLNEKGFDNIYVLNGGLKQYAIQFPDHVDGTLPSPPKSKVKARSSSRSVYKVASALSSTTKSKTSHRRHTTGGCDVNSIADSMASNLTVAESVISRATVRKKRHHVIP